MAVQLREYQQDALQRLRRAIVQNRRVLLQLPTGGGKTVIASALAEGAAAKLKRLYFICHRAELVEGTCRTFAKYGIPHGVIAAGFPQNLIAPIQVCSIDTLKLRAALLPEPDIAVWDEAHHAGAAGWMALQQSWQSAYHVGLSATPTRLDGQGLIDCFDDMVLGPAVQWLMDQGYLARYRAFAPPPPANLKARGADDGRGAQAKVLDVPKLTGDVVAHWLKHAKGMRTVGFACNRKHSQHMVDAFNAAGIPAAHLDGDTKKKERARVIKAFAAGEIQVLWNVSLFGEGFDLSSLAQTDVTVDCVILNRKTQSLAFFLQMVGRALRPNGDMIKVILDHAGNFREHGFPEDEREWSLLGQDKKAKGANDNGPPPPVTCDNCFNQIRQPIPDKCPHCEKLLRKEYKALEPAEGELDEVTEAAKAAIRRQRKREQADCDTLQELIALGRKREYANPVHWANKVWGNRRKAVS